MGRSLAVAICGAGIGGLSAAALLARQGHRVTLLDQFDTPAPVGSGLMLQVTGMAVLEQLGLGDETGRCLLYTSPSPRDKRQSRMPSSA